MTAQPPPGRVRSGQMPPLTRWYGVADLEGFSGFVEHLA